jgi:3-mercaptopyruvate sulfurtransferase SseA
VAAVKTTADWKAQAKQLIRAELKRRDLSYADLAKRMGAIGLKVNDRTIANKIATGSFSAVFFLQVMEAIGVKNLPIDTGD